mgnify:CR=1 FL=1
MWKCLLYIDLNMVRAGVVGHPREWTWTAWSELMGERRRNRVLDAEAVVELTGVLAAIACERPVPVYFIGVGEKLEDLQAFRVEEFVDALLG